jgi:hypothetical protein
MSVIVILIGLLVPALSLVRRMATDTKQRAQFHSISVALEFFSGENDGYPTSTALPVGGTSNLTVGAQHLAEALVGRDLQGYDIASSWDSEADDAVSGTDIYSGATDSLDRRRGPYLNAENVEAYLISQLYSGNTGNIYDTNNPVLTDAYRVKFITVTAGTVSRQLKVGSPILYYRADTTSRTFEYDTPAHCEESIYNIYDNDELVALGKVIDGTAHPIFDPNGRQTFYEKITNPTISTSRPYNQNTYILISAGFDGRYGTRDDITNFGD